MNWFDILPNLIFGGVLFCAAWKANQCYHERQLYRCLLNRTMFDLNEMSKWQADGSALILLRYLRTELGVEHKGDRNG